MRIGSNRSPTYSLTVHDARGRSRDRADSSGGLDGGMAAIFTSKTAAPRGTPTATALAAAILRRRRHENVGREGTELFSTFD